jgi:hypothetical protein
MEYNTTRESLFLPEYGRNVQMMAEHLLTIPDKANRTEAAKELIAIMINMNPSVRETKDYKQKMWDYLAQLCDFKLDVDFPFPISKPADAEKPERLQYNMNEIRCRHYGYTVERMIQAACDMESSEERDALVHMIANNMKRNYVIWNQKSVTDEIVINDLIRLSKGRLNLASDTRLMNVNVPTTSMPKKVNNFKRQNNNNQARRNNNNKNNNNKKRQN